MSIEDIKNICYQSEKCPSRIKKKIDFKELERFKSTDIVLNHDTAKYDHLKHFS